MKKWLFIAICCLALSLSACGGTGGRGNLANADPSKILVAYFSCTNHTKDVAEKVAEATGGTLYAIAPAEPYTDADLDYGDSSTRATVEQRDPDARPEIKGSVSDMDTFDVVYLGYPIWWGEAPKIVYTFLEAYDFSGKTVIPFCTSGSSGIEGSLPELKALTSGATWLAGKRFASNTTQNAVQTWLNGLTD